jgi:hypothetical protein
MILNIHTQGELPPLSEEAMSMETLSLHARSISDPVKNQVLDRRI